METRSVEGEGALSLLIPLTLSLSKGRRSSVGGTSTLLPPRHSAKAGIQGRGRALPSAGVQRANPSFGAAMPPGRVGPPNIATRVSPLLPFGRRLRRWHCYRCSLRRNAVKFAIYGAGAIGAYLGPSSPRSGGDVTLNRPRPSPAGHAAARRPRPHLHRGLRSAPVATDDPAGHRPRRRRCAGGQSPWPAPESRRCWSRCSARTLPCSPARTACPGGTSSGTAAPWMAPTWTASTPTRVLDRHIASERIIGCVVYPSTAVVEPGVVQHIEGNRFSIGELDGATTERWQGHCRRAHRSWTAVPHSPAHPAGHLGEAPGQHRLQPPQRAHPGGRWKRWRPTPAQARWPATS